MLDGHDLLNRTAGIVTIIERKYCSFTPAARAAFIEAVSLRTYTDGEDLVKMGQYSDQLLFIVKGGVRAYYLKDGRDITDWFAFEHHFVCAIVSFYQLVPSPHTITAMEPTEVLTIGREAMERLCAEHHCLERLGRLGTTETMLQLQERVVSLQFATAPERYAALLRRFPDIALRAPVHAVASFLGVTPETLSRIRSARGRN